MKKYIKTHYSEKAANNHIYKIKKRGGAVKTTIKKNGKIIVEYSFPVVKSKNNLINSTNTIDLIQESAKKGYRKVKVVFKAPYDEWRSKISDKNLLNSMKKEKKIILDVIENSQSIIKLLKSDDVKQIYFI
jgi:hypothetical protein